MAKYIAFLRGINVGGNTKVGMNDLRVAFNSLGLEKVKTYLNSGNVVFESNDDLKILDDKINKSIAKKLGNFKTMVRPISHLKKIVNLFPPAKNGEAPFITFFEAKPKADDESLKKARAIRVIAIKGSDVLWQRQLGAKGYADIEDIFGAVGTTRGLNTINKLSEV